MGWQPTETAPKDGTHIIVYGREYYGDGEYSDDFAVVYWSYKCLNDWQLCNVGGFADDGEISFTPTHWSSLTPPTK